MALNFQENVDVTEIFPQISMKFGV